MRQLLPLTLAAALLTGSCSLPSGFTTRDRAAIESEAKFWTDAVVAGDAEALASCYEADGVVLPGDGSPVVGTEELAAYFARWPDVRRVRMQIVELNGHGPLAYALGTLELVHANEDEADGGPPSTFRRFVSLWRRQSDGRWRLARTMWHALDPESASALERGEAGTDAGEGDAAAQGEGEPQAEAEPEPERR